MLNLRMASRDGVDRALGLFERALELSPGYVDAMIALGSALDLKGSFLAMHDLLERSLRMLQQAVALKPDSGEAHLRLGETLSDLGRIDEGIAEMQEALRLAPDDAEAHASLARNYWMGKGDADLGVVHYRRALALNPEGGYTHLQLALLHALRGELDDAEREARAAVVLQEQAMSGTQGLILVGARSRLGYVFYRRGKYGEAIREYRRELEFISLTDHALRERTTIEICQKLSAAYQRKGDGENAQAYFDRALRAFDQRLAGGGDDPYTRYYMLTTSLSQDLYKRFLDPVADERRVLAVARVTTVVAGALGTALAIVSPTVIGALTIFYTLLGVSLFVPILGGLYVPRAGTRHALVAMVLGVGTVLTVQISKIGRAHV